MVWTWDTDLMKSMLIYLFIFLRWGDLSTDYLTHDITVTFWAQTRWQLWNYIFKKSPYLLVMDTDLVMENHDAGTCFKVNPA